MIQHNINGITLCRTWTYDIGFWRPAFYQTELRALFYDRGYNWKEKDFFVPPIHLACIHRYAKKKKILSNLNRFHLINMNSSLLPIGEVIGRDDRIWTRDILYPKQTRYQAALHPFSKFLYSIIVQNPCIVFHIVIFSSIYIQFSCHFLFLVSYNKRIIYIWNLT